MLLNIFTESLKHQLLPMFDEITLPAMQAFGVSPLSEPMIAAIFGALFAACALYGVGVLFSRRMQHRQPEKYVMLQGKLRTTFMLTLLALGSPFGFMFAFCAGFFSVSLTFALPLALVGLGAHYGLAYG
jgi:membrane protein YqaA with SNARE-associated domain